MPSHPPDQREDLDSTVHARFDVVFSANVLEHVGDLALNRMHAVLAEGGVQTHLCP
jgi:2-polyprenyl-3-methyl-5-hydroxy-6-metoxy-1,4-benzoquinol methylase